ncbi:hypothetical protein BJX76DRAFT_329545 [Aspergillus varians]
MGAFNVHMSTSISSSQKRVAPFLLYWNTRMTRPDRFETCEQTLSHLPTSINPEKATSRAGEHY